VQQSGLCWVSQVAREGQGVGVGHVVDSIQLCPRLDQNASDVRVAVKRCIVQRRVSLCVFASRLVSRSSGVLATLDRLPQRIERMNGCAHRFVPDAGVGSHTQQHSRHFGITIERSPMQRSVARALVRIMERRKVTAAAVSVSGSRVHSCHSHIIATDQQPAP
jgi:hypothetical protein